MPPKRDGVTDKTDTESDNTNSISKLEINLKKLVCRRNAIFARLQKVYNLSIKAFENESSKELFLCSTATLDSLRTDFNNIVDQIIETELNINPTAVVSYDNIVTFDDLYCRCKYVESSLSAIDNTAKINTSPQRRSVRLPELELVSFSGDPIKWPLFYESFKRIIHDNADLTDHERVQYLVGKLSDRALSVCTGIIPNGDNYLTIWNALVDRYEDKRSLATAYLDQMFDFKPFNIANSKNLDAFLDKFSIAVSSLESLNIDNLSDLIILYLALKKIDPETARSFEMHKRGTALPTYKDLVTFLREQSKILNRSSNNYSTVSKRIPETVLKINKSALNNKTTHSFVTASSWDRNNKLCPLCNNKTHKLFECPVFLHLSIEKRFNFIKDRFGCTNCLSVTHRYAACKSKYNCRYCDRKHHSLLCRKPTMHNANNKNFNNNSRSLNEHTRPAWSTPPARDQPARAVRASESTPSPPRKQSDAAVDQHASQVSLCNSLNAQNNNTTCLLGTVQVNTIDLLGNLHCIRALIDSGSQNNFITLACCKKLNINSNKIPRAVVKGIGSSPNPIRGVTSITLQSRFDNNILVPIDAFILDRITDNLPTAQVDISKLSYLNNIQLADASFHTPGEIDILIGAPLFSDILLSGRVRGPQGTPTAFETIFGYIVIGNTPTVNCNIALLSLCTTVEPRLDLILQNFWQLEEVPQCEPTLSPDAHECENVFVNNYSRDTIGRYSVALPFSRDPALLGDSYEHAKKRYMFLERKLNSSSQLRLEYDAIIREYLDKGYISLIINDDRSSGYYIPHHAVARLDKTTTKWRMVMDASAKTTSGIALNDILHTGHNLQNDLFLILINFRFYKYAFTSDVKQMYLRIFTHEAHRIYQKFLYRFNSAEPLNTYQFNRVCFGLRSSPFLAMRVLRQLCADERARYPLATAVVENNCYMDDICHSMPSLAECLQLRDDLRELCTAGGFELVKWSSNTPDLLESLPEPLRYNSRIDFNDPSHTLKVLGLQWSPATDEFMFSVKLDNRPPTKRNILSVIARLYDVLGLIAPVILYAKLILQKLFILKIDWDEEPPFDIIRSWKGYIQELPAIENIHIPRHLGVFKNSKISIVAFSDASERAYGCVAYIRIENNPSDSISVYLVCAKSKVAPLKTISVARLELCSVLLMSKLVRRIIDTYKNRHIIDKIFCFTDSMVALQWVNSSPHKFKTFVATRITKILSAIPAECFYHVPGTENPSDCLSRGLSPAQILNHTLWFNGPAWLCKGVNDWPITHIKPATDISDIPEHKVTSLATTASIIEPHLIMSVSHRVSSWLMLLHVVVYVYRFIGKLPRSNVFTAHDIDFAEVQIMKVIQTAYFSEDIQNLKHKSLCSRAIRKLCPFLDNKGVLRVGGRLRHADLSYEQQHPALLPSKDRIVGMLVEHYHRLYCHTGPLALMSMLRQRFWIISCRKVVRHVTFKCNFCFRAKPKQTQPLMGDLPAYRVNETKAFIHTAVDFAGPLFIIPYRKRGVRSYKCYLCIFVCMVTRAVHVELTTDLTTNNFLNAFKRFLSRRGAVSVLYSDNAKTFVSAKNTLCNIQPPLTSDEFNRSFSNELAAHKITWKFNPPRSPHFGGNYEIYVKAFKTHLHRVVGSQLLTYEELLTIVTQIECVINSRPLTLLSEDPSELSALTPSHFLMSTPLKYLPSSIDDTADIKPRNLLNRYELLQQMVKSFANRWKLEYLHLLQSRGKWNTPSNPITIGTVVVIVTDNIPPLQWPLGVVVATYPGNDGVVRVASVRTSTGVYKRPVVRLCPLPSQ